VHRLLDAFRKTCRSLRTDPSDTVSMSDVAALMNVTVGKAEQLEQLAQSVLSLDRSVSDRAGSFGDCISDDDACNADAALDYRCARESFDHILTALTPRQRDVIELRYGLTAQGSLTLAKTAQRLGVGPNMVARLEAEVLDAMRGGDRQQYAPI
jgi:DNA-directed RNA polymerase sigma subunit (sigma70/sigma32)